MSRKPPAITFIYPTEDGSVRIEWDLDRFFPDPEEPDEVYVQIPTGSSDPLAGATRAFEIPAGVVQQYAGGTLAGSVLFKWVGPPDDVQGSPFTIVVPAGGTVPGAGGQVPHVPRVSVVARHPKTIQHQNRITIGWSSYSYTEGRVRWGPPEDPHRFQHDFRPRGDNYTGEFTTDHPLVPRMRYRFLVEVENTFEGRTAEAALEVTAVDNYRSLRQFLLAGAVRPPTGVRAHLPGATSLRTWLGV